MRLVEEPRCGANAESACRLDGLDRVAKVLELRAAANESAKRGVRPILENSTACRKSMPKDALTLSTGVE